MFYWFFFVLKEDEWMNAFRVSAPVSYWLYLFVNSYANILGKIEKILNQYVVSIFILNNAFDVHRQTVSSENMAKKLISWAATECYVSQ